MREHSTRAALPVGVGATDVVRFVLAPGDAESLRRDACARCGAAASTTTTLLPRVPLWLVSLAAIGIGLLVPLATLFAWWPGDAYDAMASGLRPPAMRALPVAVTLLVAGAAHALWAGLGRRTRLRVPSCAACRRLAARTSATTATLTASSWAVALAFFYAWPIQPYVPALLHGFLLLPAFFLSQWGADVLWLRFGASLHSAPKQRLVVTKNPRYFRELDDVAHERAARVPTRAWAIVVVVAVIVAVCARDDESLLIPCAFGTLPLAYRHGDERVVGCVSPDGARHGAWHEASDVPRWQGRYRFDERSGSFVFTQGDGGRVEARFCRSRPCGTWRYVNADGSEYRSEVFVDGALGSHRGERCDFSALPLDERAPCLPYERWP